MLFCLLAELSETTPNEPNHQTLTPFSLILPNIWESFITFARILMDKIVANLKKYGSRVNKYWLTVIIFVVVTFFIGDSTIMHRVSYDRQINQLENEIDFYTQEKEKDLEKLKALESDNETLEQFAREEYRMTKDNEELFIIVD